MPRSAIIAALLVGVAALAWRFPLIHFSRLDRAVEAEASAKFDAAAFAERFWDHDLTPALADAAELADVLPVLRSDPQAACGKWGRSVGLSRSCLYLVRGRGVVSSVENSAVKIILDREKSGDVELATAMVFGSVVRDVTGRIDPAALADSRDLNQAATEINRLVQERVIAKLKDQATEGATVSFVACGQVQGKLVAGKPWKLIPLEVEVEGLKGRK